VHMLSNAAFNALLKTLEEPPAHAIFIFATTESHKVPPTVISRCQRYDFKRIGIEQIVEQLQDIAGKEGLEAETAALFAIAKKADGSMRDAESIFDQVVGYSAGSLTYANVREVLHVVDEDLFFETTESILAQDTQAAFDITHRVVMSGHDIQEFLGGLEEHFRNILVAQSVGHTDLIEASSESKARYAGLASKFKEGDILRLLKLNADAMQSVRASVQPRLKLEVALVNMIRMDSTVKISSLLERIGSIPLQPAAGMQERSHTATAAGAVSTAAGAVSTAAGAVSMVAGESAARYADAYAADGEQRSPAGSTSEQQQEISTVSGAHTGTGAAKQHSAPPPPLVQLLMDELDAELLPPSTD